MWCELEALICSGAIRGRQHTLALVADRVPETPVKERDEALGELATRYFRSHGPAQATDFAWWSGLRLSEARRAIDIAGDALYGPGLGDLPDPAGRLHLLPKYDEYVVAYKDRSALLVAGGAAAVPIDSNLIVLGGRVIGEWKRTVQAGVVRINFPTIPPDKSPNKRLLAASHRFGEFLGLPVEFDVRTSADGA
jgi:hypothetical protein